MIQTKLFSDCILAKPFFPCFVI